MPTRSPFDVRIVNSLERPTINDFNLGQAAARTSVQKLAELTLDMPNIYNSEHGSGFYGNGFQVVPYSGMTVTVSPGMGFAYYRYGTPQYNVGGVAGVDVFATAGTTPLVMNEPGREIELTAAPAVGMARLDVIAVKRAPIAELSDYTTTDTFNPTAQVFAPSNKPKTLTWVLNDADVQTLAPGQTATAPFVYIPGVEFADSPTNFYSVTPPEVPPGYDCLAVLNVSGGITTITADRIRDYRKLLFSSRTLSFPITFTGGAGPGPTYFPGTLLAFVPPTLPGNMARPVITLSNYEVSNRYTLILPGFVNAKAITATLTAAGPFALTGTYAFTVAVHNPQLPFVVTNELPNTKMDPALVGRLADANYTAPATQFAIGQPYVAIDFELGVVDIAPPTPGANYTATTFNSIGDLHQQEFTGTVTISY